MTQRLSTRLECIAQWVPEGARVVDVGTDHALLPVALMERGVAQRVIASDIAQGPLESAKWNVRRAGFSDVIDVRLGPGLTTVDPGEVDAAIIAGMGGGTAAEVLKGSPEVVRKLKRLIIQPMNAASRLRQTLREVQFLIIDERIVRDGDRTYQFILAKPCESSKVANSPYAPYINRNTEWAALEFGPINLSHSEDALVRSELETAVHHLETILRTMPSVEPESPAAARRLELKEQLRQIKGELRQC